MNGRSIGMGFGFLAGARVGGELTFVPAHINAAGKKISHRCDVPVYVNSNRGNNGEGKHSLMKVTIWGELARKAALTLSQGKAIDTLVELSSYQGKVYKDRQLQMGADGQPLTTNKTSMTVMRIVFGEETRKFAEAEVAANLRPANWDNPAHPDWQLWKDELNRRINLQYVGGDKFGYARVIQPQGQILPPEQAASAYTPQNTTSPAATGSFGPQPAPQYNGQFAGQPMAGAPVAPETQVQGAFNVAPQAPTMAPATTGFGQPTARPQQAPVATGSFGV